jgi:hypothetical protein
MTVRKDRRAIHYNWQGSRSDPLHLLSLTQVHYRATGTFDNALFLHFENFLGVFCEDATKLPHDATCFAGSLAIGR